MARRVGRVARRDGPLPFDATMGRARVIEGLDPSGVEQGEYELICLPINVRRSDAHRRGRS